MRWQVWTVFEAGLATPVAKTTWTALVDALDASDQTDILGGMQSGFKAAEQSIKAWHGIGGEEGASTGWG